MDDISNAFVGISVLNPPSYGWMVFVKHAGNLGGLGLAWAFTAFLQLTMELVDLL
ncbi:MAG: hypothetical protein ACFB11_09475 [Paracoccaceae bacterium]